MLQRTYFRTVTKWVNTILFSTLQCAELTFSIFWDKICMDYLENWLFMDKKQGNVTQVQLWEISWRCLQKRIYQYRYCQHPLHFWKVISYETLQLWRIHDGWNKEAGRKCTGGFSGRYPGVLFPQEYLISAGDFRKSQGGDFLLRPSRCFLRVLKESDHQLSLSNGSIHIQQ